MKIDLPTRPKSPTSLKHREVRHGGIDSILKTTYRKKYSPKYWEVWDKRAIPLWCEIRAQESPSATEAGGPGAG